MTGLLGRFEAVLRRIRNPKAERRLLVVAALVFVIAGAIGWASLPADARNLQWGWVLLVAVVGVPAVVVANGAEYAATARLLDQRPTLRRCANVTVLATAANQLPLPGSALVRTAALVEDGATTSHSIAATGAVGALWIATTLAIAAAANATAGAGSLLASVFLAAGATLVGGLGATLIRRRFKTNQWFVTTLGIAAVEVLSVAASALRFALVLLALGVDVTLRQAVTLTIAGVIASAAGIFPGGLGIRELASAIVSPLVGLPASVGLVAAALGRLVELAIFAPLTILLLLRRSHE